MKKFRVVGQVVEIRKFDFVIEAEVDYKAIEKAFENASELARDSGYPDDNDKIFLIEELKR
jgi:hypothetical protein